MVKKVLIPVKENKLKPIGGPYGYLFNLKQGLDQCSETDIEISFLESESEKKKKEGKVSLKKALIKFYNQYIMVRVILAPLKRNNDFSAYDVIHFHSTLDMYLFQNSLKTYNGKVLLTSHSPIIWHKEFIKMAGFRSKFAREIIKKTDEYAFNRADYIVFPCKEAEEPYYNSWEKWTEIKGRKEGYFKYILTGLYECKVLEKKEDVRKKYNIPQEAKLLCYVGRHNEIKGYDLLQEAYLRSLKEQGYWVIVAGKDLPIRKITGDTHWIEVGWTSDPYSIINASDIFILPNRETYFDLIVLEVLSLGKNILMSDTGGNRFFKKYNSDGIIYFERNNVEELIKAINIFFSDNEKRAKGEAQNLNIFFKDYTVEKFASNYIELIRKLFKE